MVCPGCSVLRDGALELRTLAPAGDVLACACGRRYPVIDGVPVVLRDPAAFLRAEATALVERDLPPEVVACLVADGPDDAAYPRLVEHLSIYLDAHWGDLAAPPVPAAGPALIERIAQRRAAPVATAIELGCSAGRGLAALALGAAHVVGVDLQLPTLRRARRLLDGEPVAYARRQVGRRYAPARAEAGPHAVPAARRTLVCADALDPPFPPGHFDRVVAFNVLDSVRSPRQLLAVVDALCAPGGEVLLASPYAWQSAVMDEDERVGGDDPAAWLRGALEAGDGLRARYAIEDEATLPWALRRDARATLAYQVHYLRARRA